MLSILLFLVEIINEKLKDTNRQVTLPAKPYGLIEAESKILRCEVHRLVHSVWNKYDLFQQ
jgi:hypothetical protein